MLIAAPWLVFATDGTDGDISQIISQVARSVSDLQAQITGLGSKVDSMSSRLDSLNSRVESMALADIDANMTAPGTAECLAVCRKTATTCLNAGPVTPTIGAPPTAAPTINLGVNRAACMTQSSSCIRNCKPQTTALSCDASCAVQLGICIRGSGGDGSLAKACRTANETCLISTCTTAQTVNVGALRATVSIILPPGTCQSQCSLEQAVCRQAARFDQTALDECTQVYKSCSQIVCSGTTRETAPSATAPTGRATPKNIICENTCTDTYYRCRQTAGSDQTALTSCSDVYGTCRNQCLIQSGGGFGTGD